MRILYVSQYFPPEVGAPASRVYELSREWVRAGHRVTVLTAFPHHPLGVKRSEDKGVLHRWETMDGIDILRTYVYAAPNKGTLRRMVSYASFMLSAFSVGSFQLCRPDVVIATSPQMLCGMAGYAIARFLRAPFVFEVRDLWPESILAVGAMKETMFIRALRAMASFLYRRSERIVTVGDGYKSRISSLYGTPLEKIEVIPNGIDATLFRPGPRENTVREEFGWGDKFVVLYIGTLGMAHALGYVLEAARLLEEEKEILFVLVGEGAERQSLMRQSVQWSLPNVQFINQQPKARVPLFYSACDLGLVTLRKADLFCDVIPSKIFEYLGMERPILLTVRGEARKLIERTGAGTFVPPEDASAMADAIRRLAMDRPQLNEMSRKGRKYVLQHHDRDALARQYLTILRKVSSE